MSSILGHQPLRARALIAGALAFLTHTSHPLLAALSQECATLVAAGIACNSIRKRRPVHRWAWAFVAAAAVCWALGDVIWQFIETIQGERPNLSVADALYLLGYPLLAAGFIK